MHMLLLLLLLLVSGAEVTNELFNSIQNVILRALLAVQPSMINDKHCFEVSAAAAAAAAVISWRHLPCRDQCCWCQMLSTDGSLDVIT
jgi:hypothetical protein